MKKNIIIIGMLLLMVGCSSTKNEQQMFIEAASACNNICKENTSVSEISSSAGVGSVLLLIGGMETSCKCAR